MAISSVSRVLSNHPDVSDVMRERVMSAVDELGYEPDWIAQSMRRQATRTVGFALADISNQVLAQIVLGAETVLHANGYSTVITNSEGDGTRDAENVVMLCRRRVDGFLVASAVEDHQPTLAALRESESPVVAVDRDLPESLGASAAYFDHRSGMRAAVGYLLDQGHRRISLVLGQRWRPTEQRRLGLQDAYSERGLPDTFDVIEGRYAQEHGSAAAERVLDLDDPPTALVAGSNQLLAGVLRTLKRRGLRVGTDISVASCDEVSLTELHDPPIAVVHRPNRELGQRSAELLLARLAGDPRSTVTLDTHFEPRASCAPPPASRSHLSVSSPRLDA